MKTCATCEHFVVPVGGAYEMCRKFNHSVYNNLRQSCTEHSEKVEKKKVLIRYSLCKYSNGYWVNANTDTDEDNSKTFVRWLTPEDMRKIMSGEKIEVEP